MGNCCFQQKYIPETSQFKCPDRDISFKETMFIALYDFVPNREDELSFKANDLLLVIAKSDETWWFAEHQRTRKRGYVPYNFVTKYDNDHKIVPGWCDITRLEADQKLRSNHNPVGTYLIRPSSDKRHLALSIRCVDEDDEVIIQHHKIAFRVQEYYIDRKRKFQSLNELILHYHKSSDTILSKLTNPFHNERHSKIQFRDIEISRDSIKLIKKIGSGHFGEVYMAQLRGTNVAVKQLSLEATDKSKILKEAKLMHRLHHKRIVELLGVCTSPASQPIYIITELMEKGSLLDYLHSPEGQLLQFNSMLIMLMEISDGMAYLESKSYIHRDLRAANILVGSNDSVKVADFGLAGIVEDVYIYAEEDYQFPIRWVAEETLASNKFSLKSDVWSFGVLMLEIMTHGEPPYKELHTREVADKVKGGYRMKRPDGCPDRYYQIIQTCWKKHRERPTFKFLHYTFKNWVNECNNMCSSASSLFNGSTDV